jgi:hypothetical protein
MNDMKLLIESWRRYTGGKQVISEGLMDLLGKAKSKIQRRLRSGRITPYSEGEGNWLEITVPYSDADVEIVSEDVLLFVAIVDKLAEEMGINEPTITSGYRDALGQARAMHSVWLAAQEEGKGEGYLVWLYGEECKSCAPGAGKIAAQVEDIFFAYPDESEAIDAASQILSNNLISNHMLQPAAAVDYRIRGQEDAIRVIEAVFKRGYASGEAIQERFPPHYHATVDSVTPAGIEYLQTPNKDSYS